MSFEITLGAFEMTAKEVEKSISEIWELFKETDRRLEQSALRLDEEIAKVSKAIGDLGGKWGKFVEGIIAPSAEKMFQERGIPVQQTFPRARASRNGQRMEIDLLLVNSNELVVIEVKSTLCVDDVKEFIERLPQVREFFKQYAEHRIYGAVAGMVIEEGADRFAYKNGLFVIGQKGDLAEIVNDKKFKPKVW